MNPPSITVGACKYFCASPTTNDKSVVMTGTAQRLSVTYVLAQMIAFSAVASCRNPAVNATAISATTSICHSFGPPTEGSGCGSASTAAVITESLWQYPRRVGWEQT